MSLENEFYFFLKKENPIFSIKLGQRLPKSFSQLHVKNSRFFLSYFLQKDDWTKAYASPRLPTLLYRFSVPKDKERLKLWKQAIKTENFELKPGKVVCSKHFLPDDISWGAERKYAFPNKCSCDE